MTTITQEPPAVTGDYVELDGERYFRIANSQAMPDFFMSLVGAGDHWMFISSSGALTAGRCDPDSALFPYAADDQITVARGTTGPTTLIRWDDGMATTGSPVWEPFATLSPDAAPIHRNLYKTPLGNKLVFEEVHEAEQLAFRYQWAFSENLGFVRSCRVHNLGDRARRLRLLDGLQNVLPYGVGSEFMMRFSNLANAYKKSELLEESGVGVFYLSSIPTDRAEPSEGLRATTVWQTGLSPDAILLSTDQVARFHAGDPLTTEADVRGKAGAYLLHQAIELAAGKAIQWHVVAELNQDHADVIGLDRDLQDSTPAEMDRELAADIESGQRDLLRIVSSADGRQAGANERRANRHLSNTVFNVMRGGVPLEDYGVRADDFRKHVAGFNQSVAQRHQGLLADLPPALDAAELKSRLEPAGDADLTRLAAEYLPLAFSRRHGDPTRPWNRFAIRLRSDSGRTNLNYQGNWRDIFQNWEALAASFPQFTTAMVCRFVNATTADGYNPYRLTKDGFEWEEPTPDDPWANIGYWGDHQIIYLLKLLEWNRSTDPASLDELLNSAVFVHANVPYRIKDFDEIRRDPRATIRFDAELSRTIAQRVSECGGDGKLLTNQVGGIHHVTLLEKLLTLSLAKLSNFVPDGGIWLNTQRPEWNDANNALVGYGLSMVTACYLHRWFGFLHDWLAQAKGESFQVSEEVRQLFDRIAAVLQQYAETLGNPTDAAHRRRIVEALSRAGSDYRNRLYDTGVSGRLVDVSRADCLGLFNTARRHLAATIRNNRRQDGLFHAYNLLDWTGDGIDVDNLDEMLEGQVAALSSGLLSAEESVALLDALRRSNLYRADQDSYLLYPDRELPRFLHKNQLDPKSVEDNLLLRRLLADGHHGIVRRDVLGGLHFNGSFRNSADVKSAVAQLPPQYQNDVDSHGDTVAELFEELFGHRRFTGRSGTFFAYEGLGSIYWHMVSKLGLAVCENFFQAIDTAAAAATTESLRDHFQAIRRGIGAEKSPVEYGGFPTDPYSHTPENAGVKQPGMTGQVKEDLLSRFAETGVHVADGCLQFRLELFDREELLGEPGRFTFSNLLRQLETVPLPAGGFGYTFCQVPITYEAGEQDTIRVHWVDREPQTVDGLQLDADISRRVFARSGEIKMIACRFRALN